MADQLAPNLLTLDPVTGAIGEDFSGHVHAAGLDLDAGVTGTPPSNDRIRWLTNPGGGLVADIFAASIAAATTELAGINAYALAQAHASLAELSAVDDQLNTQANISVQQRNRGGGSVTATAGTQSVSVIDQAGDSSFLRLSSGSPSAFWAGALNGGGGVRLGGTGNWTVVRTAAGTYTLTLNNGINGVWAIATAQVNEAGGSQPAIDVDYISLVGGTTTLTVKTISDPFGLTDLNWSFSAIATNN